MTGLSPSSVRATRRAEKIIERLLKEMELFLKTPEQRTPAEWERLFGSKPSMVANLQKLVSALSALPVEKGAKAQKKERAAVGTATATLTVEEMQLLADWLRDGGH